MKLPTRNAKHGTRDQRAEVREPGAGRAQGSRFKVQCREAPPNSPLTPALRIIPHLPPRMGRYIQTFCLDRLAFTLALRPAALLVSRLGLMFTRRVFPQAQVSKNGSRFPVIFRDKKSNAQGRSKRHQRRSYEDHSAGAVIRLGFNISME